MTDPFALLPLAVAAGGGRVDGFEAQQLVAAGLTLLQRSAPLVRALSGRRAAILLPTSPAFLVALAACEGRGAVLVNPLAAPAEIAYQLADAHVGAVLTTAALASRIPASRVPDSVARVLLDDAPRAARVVAAGASRDVDLGSHFGLPLEGDTAAPGRDEEAGIVYTSAMAGTPLGAVLTHRNLVANARSTIEAARFTADDHVLALLPWSHLFGLTVTGSAPLLAGARVTTTERFDPVRAVQLLAGGGITAVAGAPAIFRALLASVGRERSAEGRERPFPALRLCICGGAPLAREMQDAWADATGVELRQGYGLTEGGPVCLFSRDARENVRGTLGLPLPGVDVEIRSPVTWDAEGRPHPPARDAALPDGAMGEICVRGENVFAGYLRDGDCGLLVRDGWLRTGDLGHRNVDGTVTFDGIAKPMFTRHGFNVYPREIERVVTELPGVRAASATPIPEPSRENDVALVVRGDVRADDVRRWCEERLGAYKQPTTIEVAP